MSHNPSKNVHRCEADRICNQAYFIEKITASASAYLAEHGRGEDATALVQLLNRCSNKALSMRQRIRRANRPDAFGLG